MINYYSMDGCEDQQSFRLRLEAVQYFKSLIMYRQKEGKPTRLVNFAGHVGRHMRKEVRNWFINLYPNTGDYAKFFFEHEDEFAYDPLSGEVKLIDYMNTFKKPNYLTQLESKAREPNASLIELSSIMLEFECFHATFMLLKDGVSQNDDSIPVKQLTEIIEQIESDGLLLRTIHNLLENESISAKRNRLVYYLMKNYPTVFLNDESKADISLTPQTIQHLVKASKQIDDTIYVILKPLLVKFLVKNGPKDVDVLQDSLAMRHTYIVNYLFGNSDDYSMFDFVLSYSDDFEYKRVTNDDSTVSRMICAKNSDKLNGFEDCTHNNNNSVEQRDNGQNIMPDLDQTSNAKDIDLINSLFKKAKARQIPEPVVETSNPIEQNGTKNQCCVCEMDRNPELGSKQMNFAEFKKFAMTHRMCLMRRMIVDLKKDAEKKHKQLNRVTKASQTVSTGTVFSVAAKDLK